MAKPPLFIRSMFGLGDNVYERPFVRSAALKHEVWINTCWPELFWDLGVHFVEPHTRLRTQARNAALHKDLWVQPPSACTTASFSYGSKELAKGNILQALGRSFSVVEPFFMDLPPLPPSPVVGEYVVVRPVSYRVEWMNPARNPKPEYVASAATLLRDNGYRVVSVADIVPNVEWIDPIEADIRFEHGELSVLQLLALYDSAKIVVSGVGHAIPICLASKTPCIVIAGGQGGHNAPEMVQDPRLPTGHMHWILPQPYCRCINMRHNCLKDIPKFTEKFRALI